MAAPATPAFIRDPAAAETSAGELGGLREAPAEWTPEQRRNRTAQMQSLAPDNAPDLSVRAVSALLLCFEKLYGRERLESLWQRENLGLSLDYLAATTNFVSLNFLENLCELLVRETGDPRFCRKAGCFTAQPEALGFVFYAVKAFGSPRACHLKMIELSTTYNRVGEFSVEQIDDRRLTFPYR